MVTYYKGPTIPTSHIQLYDPDNVSVACNIFRVYYILLFFCKCSYFWCCTFIAKEMNFFLLRFHYSNNANIQSPLPRLYRPCYSLLAQCYFNIIKFSIPQDLCKYMRGEHKNETQAIQYIIGSGLEREELRDEIFVQCIRQVTNNPSAEATERLWLLLCLAVVAFQPSKLLNKVDIVLFFRL